MTKQTGGLATAAKPAAERIEEARQLTVTIGDTLKKILDLVEEGAFDNIGLLPRQITRLTDALADVRKQEAAFNDKFGTGLADDEIDFRQLRCEIGCRLGRIRKCCGS